MRWIRPRTLAPVYLLAAVGLLTGLSHDLGFFPNLTPSLPRGLYRLSARPVEPGVLVATCLPLKQALEGRQRGYLPAGRCPGDVSPVLKRVAATPGDVVEVGPEGVWAGGELIQGPAPRVDHRGRPLEPLPQGRYTLAPDELWLYTPRSRSWDSRFYGPVSASNVLGTVWPVWTFPRESPGSSR